MAAALLLLCAAVLAGCGEDEDDAKTPQTGFAAALETVGSSVSPSGSGFGWFDIEAASQAGRGDPTWAAAALGPGGGELFTDRNEVRSHTGLDPFTAAEAISIVGSYTFAVRLDGVRPGRLTTLYERAGATSSELDGWRTFDLAPTPQVPLGTPLQVLSSRAARAAIAKRSVVLSRFEPARAALIGGGASPLSDDRLDLAVECLGEVIAAEVLPAGFTHNKVASPELLAVGVRTQAPSRIEEVLCAIDASPAAVDGYAAGMREAFAPGAREPLTGEPIRQLVSAAEVDELDGETAHAARAVLSRPATADPGLLFAAMHTGIVLPYVGGPAPGPDP